jgi:putative SOS response-associated peptidase YedK
MINARAETVAQKPAFRSCLRQKRCLVIADGFYEWEAGAGRKQPMRITLASGAPLACAGLWDEWKAPGGEEAVRPCTIITTEPNGLMVDIHNRMPVILKSNAQRVRMDPGVHNSQPVDYPPDPIPCRSDGGLPGVRPGKLA